MREAHADGKKERTDRQDESAESDFPEIHPGSGTTPSPPKQALSAVRVRALLYRLTFHPALARIRGHSRT
jgi:hypothetical protein